MTKNKIMPFNFSTKYDFIPKYNINGQELEVVYETKLLGVIIASGLATQSILLKKQNQNCGFSGG